MGITRNQAQELFLSHDLIGVGMEADAVRRRLHPEGVVTYLLDGHAACSEVFADAGAAPSDPAFEQLCRQITHTIDLGGESFTLDSEVTSSHTLPWYEALFRNIKGRFPSLWLHSFSATGIHRLAQSSGISLEDALRRLHGAGLDSIPGDDAGILDDAVQHEASRNISAEEWLAVHRAAHRLGLQTTASMTFGAGETVEHRINHLEAIHRLQQETQGFTAFTPYTFLPPAFMTKTSSSHGFEEATAVENLKTLAVSRIFLDNIPNLQAHLPTQGLKVLQVTLRFGVNDAGSILRAQDANAATEEQVRQVIRDAGFNPVHRDTLYRTMLLA